MKDGMEEGEAFVDKVITIHDYYDGLILGVATFNGEACIYEFDEPGDPYSTLYYLTPIDSDTLDMVMADWERWINWVKETGSANGWKEQKQFELQDVAKASPNYRKYVKHASFRGGYKNFHSHIDNLKVVWSD